MKKSIVLIFFLSFTLIFIYCKPINKNKNYGMIFIQEKEDVDHVTYSTIFLFNALKDTILIYDYQNDTLKHNNTKSPFIISSKKRKSNNERIISFFRNNGIKKDQEKDSLLISFEKNNIVKINTDEYFLDKEYYDFLKNKVLSESAIIEVAYLLKDNLGDYPIAVDLLNKNWEIKEPSFKGKILKAKIKTLRGQADMIDNWNVDYKYSSTNKMKFVIKKSTEGEIGFEKRLINESEKYDTYKRFRNIEDRLITEDTVFYNKKDNTDSIRAIYYRNGLNIEEKSIQYFTKKEIYNIDNLLFNSDSIVNVINKKR